MRARYLAVLLLALLAAAVGLQRLWMSGRVDASGLLLESAKKAHHVDYTGLVETTTSYRGRQIHALARVYHKGMGDRMEYLSAPVKGTVVVGTQDQTLTLHPLTGKTAVSPNDAQVEEEEKARLLLRNYSAYLAGRETVAGRPALIVDIVPKRQGNPSKRIWVDEKTYLVIRQENRSAEGSIKSVMTFKQISYRAEIPVEKFELVEGSTDRVEAVKLNQPMAIEELSRELGFKVTKPGYVPQGYRLTGSHLYWCQCANSHKAAVLRFTDGLNSISVFETALDVDCGSATCKMGDRKMSSNCEVGSCQQAQLGYVRLADKSVLVIGDLPPKEIEKISKSVK